MHKPLLCLDSKEAFLVFAASRLRKNIMKCLFVCTVASLLKFTSLLRIPQLSQISHFASHKISHHPTAHANENNFQLSK